MIERDGLEYPTVTEVLRAAGLAEAPYLSPAMARGLARGRALHLAIQYHAEGTLDPASLHPEIEGAFRAYLRFREEVPHAVLATETTLFHPTWQFCGRPDRVADLDGHAGVAILDWKLGESPDLEAARYQLAGYRVLWAAHAPDRPAERGYAVRLGRDGRYSLHDLTDPEASQVFLAALILYRARLRDGRLTERRST